MGSQVAAKLGDGGGFLTLAPRSTPLARTITRCQRCRRLREEAYIGCDWSTAGAGGTAKDSGAGYAVYELCSGIPGQDLFPRLLWIDACHARIINPKRSASYPDLAG